jgi:predicted phosphoribosyltransferase
VLCPHQPQPFYAVGQWYERFDQVDDDEVITILRGHADGR